MELAQAGVPLSFEVTFDQPNLHVAMSVYDTTGSSPVQVQAPAAMALVYGNTYVGKFTGDNGKSYVIVKAVYTSNLFTDFDPNYSQGSESILAQFLGAPPPSGVVGYVDNQPPVVGVVECA